MKTEKEYILDFKIKRDFKTRNDMIMKYYSDVVALATKLHYDAVERQELVQEGIVGILLSFEDFNLSKNEELGKWIYSTAQKYMSMYLKKSVTDQLDTEKYFANNMQNSECQIYN